MDDPFRMHQGGQWLSGGPRSLEFVFSGDSPHTSDEWASDMSASVGFPLPRAGRLLAVDVMSDSSAPAPSASCAIAAFIKGSEALRFFWDGSSFIASTHTNVKFAADTWLSFQYIDDSGGQSASKVIGRAEIAWSY